MSLYIIASTAGLLGVSYELADLNAANAELNVTLRADNFYDESLALRTRLPPVR